MSLDTDPRHMRMALELAQQGLGLTSPNPAVGALVVQGGEVVGEGFHQRAGEPHAEVLALRVACTSRWNPAFTTERLPLAPA